MDTLPANEQEDQTMTNTPPQVEQTEREAFEAWAASQEPRYKIDRGPEPWGYHWNSTQCAWEAWRAGRASMQAQAPQSAEPFTRAQIVRLYANSPLAHGDVTSRDAFIRIVHLVEQAHGIGGKQ